LWQAHVFENGSWVWHLAAAKENRYSFESNLHQLSTKFSGFWSKFTFLKGIYLISELHLLLVWI
jgi:hypothetical protein